MAGTPQISSIRSPNSLWSGTARRRRHDHRAISVQLPTVIDGQQQNSSTCRTPKLGSRSVNRYQQHDVQRIRSHLHGHRRCAGGQQQPRLPKRPGRTPPRCRWYSAGACPSRRSYSRRPTAKFRPEHQVQAEHPLAVQLRFRVEPRVVLRDDRGERELAVVPGQRLHRPVGDEAVTPGHFGGPGRRVRRHHVDVRQAAREVEILPESHGHHPAIVPSTGCPASATPNRQTVADVVGCQGRAQSP